MPVNTVFKKKKSLFTHKRVLLSHSLPGSFAVKFVSLEYENIFILQTSVEINCWRADSTGGTMYFKGGSNCTVVSLSVNNMAEILSKKKLTKTFPCERDCQWLSQSLFIHFSTIPVFYSLQGKRNTRELPSLALKLWYRLISAQPRVQKEKLLSWKCTEVTWCLLVGHN